MDILIKNMEMPVDCRYCRFYRKQKDGINYCHAQRRAISGGIEVLDKIRKNCPLVALPEHGDLIDRDELLTDLADRICVDDMLDGIYQPAIDRINEAKTVLEASNGTDN